MDDGVTTKFATDQPPPSPPTGDSLTEAQMRVRKALAETSPFDDGSNRYDGTV